MKTSRMMLLGVVGLALVPAGFHVLRAQQRLATAKYLQRVANTLAMQLAVERDRREERITLLELFQRPVLRAYKINDSSAKGPYVFQLLSADAGQDRGALIAFELLSNHAGRGATILFEDGHAQFVKANEYRVILEKWKDRVVDEWRSDE